MAQVVPDSRLNRIRASFTSHREGRACLSQLATWLPVCSTTVCHESKKQTASAGTAAMSSGSSCGSAPIKGEGPHARPQHEQTLLHAFPSQPMRPHQCGCHTHTTGEGTHGWTRTQSMQQILWRQANQNRKRQWRKQEMCLRQTSESGTATSSQQRRGQGKQGGGSTERRGAGSTPSRPAHC